MDTDKRHRLHRMRARVSRDMDAIAGSQRSQLQAYADGVNAGLAALRPDFHGSDLDRQSIAAAQAIAGPGVVPGRWVVRVHRALHPADDLRFVFHAVHAGQVLEGPS